VLRFSKSKKNKRIRWRPALDVAQKLQKIISSIENEKLKTTRIFCVRSSNAKTQAFARIWGLSRIWQEVLKQEPAYIIEVISEKFDKLSDKEKDRVLLHELAHIPRNVSGALLPHRSRGKGKFKDKLKRLIYSYEKK